jgi:hypothetical protein
MANNERGGRKPGEERVWALHCLHHLRTAPTGKVGRWQGGEGRDGTCDHTVPPMSSQGQAQVVKGCPQF